MAKRKKRFAEPKRTAPFKKSDQDIIDAFVKAAALWAEMSKLPIDLLVSEPAQTAVMDLYHAAIDLIFRWPVGTNKMQLDTLTRELTKNASSLPLESRVFMFVRELPQIRRWSMISLETAIREMGLFMLPITEVVYLWQCTKTVVIEELRRRVDPDKASDALRWLFDIGIMMAATFGSSSDREYMVETGKLLQTVPDERSIPKLADALDLLMRTIDALISRMAADGRWVPQVNEYERALTKLQLLRAFWNTYALAIDDQLVQVYNRSKRDKSLIDSSFWAVRVAEPIFVRNEFVRMFEDNLGEPMTQPLWDTDVPVPQGFVWLDGSQIEVKPYSGERLAGLLWTKATGKVPILEASITAAAVGVAIYPVFEGPKGLLGSGNPALWLFEKTADEPSDVDDKEYHVSVRRLAGSLWSLMSHKLVRVSRERPSTNRTISRPQEPVDLAPEIQVIELRAIEYVKRHRVSKRDESTRKRAAPRYRVVVRRHRINQWFASEGRHKVQWRPLDPDYVIIRGPEDAPLKLDTKLLAVVR